MRGQRSVLKVRRSPDGALVDGMHRRSFRAVKHTTELIKLRHAADNPAHRSVINSLYRERESVCACAEHVLSMLLLLPDEIPVIQASYALQSCLIYPDSILSPSFPLACFTSESFAAAEVGPTWIA